VRKQRGSGGKTSVEVRSGKLVSGLSVRLSVRCDWLIELSQSLEVELVRVSLAMDFGHDVFVVVVPQSSAEFVVVHVGFVLALAPFSRDFVGIH